MKSRPARNVIVLCLGLLLWAVPAWAQVDIQQLEQEAFFSAADAAARFVVKVECVGGAERVGQQLVSSAPTSGVIVGQDGYIACSAYAFANEPTSVLVELQDGRRHAAQVVAQDHRYGLVLLKVSPDATWEVPVPFNSSSVEVGQWAITVARTLAGSDFNVSVGIVSAKNRVWGKAIQLDANVSPSNYGGALVGIDGQIIGILVPRSPNSDEIMAGTEWYDSGIGFAIPLDRVLEQLERWKQGDLHPGKIGITMKSENLYGEIPEISVCRPKSPAREVDLRKGDKVVAANGVPISSYAQLKHILGPMLAGDTLALDVEREGAVLQKTLELIDKLEPYQHALLGVLPGLATQEPGMPVRWVFPGSPADEQGVQPGDRIVKLSGEPMADEAAVRQVLAAWEPGQQVELVLVRGEEQLEPMMVTLVADALELPASLPDRFADAPASSEELPPVGKIRIKLPEEINDCDAYIPETYDGAYEHGLLVLLPDPGEKDIADLIRHWRDVCNQKRTVLLVPQARDERSWEPSETQFIRKTIDNLRKEYRIDADRIAVFGKDSSGAMAYLTGFTYRDLLRGVAVVDAGIPRSSPALFNEPLQRLSIWVAGPQEGRMTRRIEGNVELLRKLKFPVSQQMLESTDVDDAMRENVLRWLDTLDRL